MYLNVGTICAAMGALGLAWAHPVGAQVITRLLALIASKLIERIC